MWYKNVVRFVTLHTFDRQTDGQTDAHRKTVAAKLQCGKKAIFSNKKYIPWNVYLPNAVAFNTLLSKYLTVVVMTLN